MLYKIVTANAVIVVIGTVAGTALMRRFLLLEPEQSPIGLTVLLALAGVIITLLVNLAIVRLALMPLALLERTAARVQHGDLAARVPHSALADREMERLAGTFNGMLDTLGTYRQRLRDMAARALNASEEERKRIARELHDDTAQSLAALLIRLRIARGRNDPEERDAVLDELKAGITEALDGVRRFARGLRPVALEELGLVPALEAHVRVLGETVGINLRLEASPLDDVLSAPAELALYRIVQEALSNAVRHASPSRATVKLWREPHAVIATVEDDGRGFSVEEIMRSGEGLGLFGMRERAEYVGGHVEVRSAPGRGTCVRVEMPTAE
jgi:two-component system sensor histidine kinase UhpB